MRDERSKIEFWTTFVSYTKLIFPLLFKLESFENVRKYLESNILFRSEGSEELALSFCLSPSLSNWEKTTTDSFNLDHSKINTQSKLVQD